MMEHSIPLDPDARADHPDEDRQRHDGTHEILSDLAYKRTMISNLMFYGTPKTDAGRWVLIDAGIPGMASRIEEAARERFGAEGRPVAMILTHGHIDHVGSLEALAKSWNVPIYAHPDELPYLNGTAAYPPPDPHVGGGIMSWLSPLFPRHAIDVSDWLRPLPADGSVPEMPGWKWLHTPGHSPGHVSLWRESDRTLIAGDAFITTAQESAYAVLTQKPEMHGPPMYFTQNWEQAYESVVRLEALKPEIAVTGHGRAMHGEVFAYRAEPARGTLSEDCRACDRTLHPSSDPCRRWHGLSPGGTSDCRINPQFHAL